MRCIFRSITNFGQIVKSLWFTKCELSTALPFFCYQHSYAFSVLTAFLSSSCEDIEILFLNQLLHSTVKYLPLMINGVKPSCSLFWWINLSVTGFSKLSAKRMIILAGWSKYFTSRGLYTDIYIEMQPIRYHLFIWMIKGGRVLCAWIS